MKTYQLKRAWIRENDEEFRLGDSLLHISRSGFCIVETDPGGTLFYTHISNVVGIAYFPAKVDVGSQQNVREGQDEIPFEPI